MEFELRCKNDHSFVLDASGLESYIDEGNFVCEECEAEVDLDNELTLQCQVCSQPYSVNTLQEARWARESPCGHCETNGMEGTFHVPGSRGDWIAEYEWVRNGATPQKLQRRGREDYWEGVIHFCDREQFIAIYKEQRIRAYPTGYFNAPAVCLTETPIPYSSELRERHGQYGYVFRKSQIIAVGGNPAIYLLPNLIITQQQAGGFAPQVKPFVNLLRIPSAHPGKSRHDFLHEREWRTAADIDLATTVPYAVILPSGSPSQKFSGDDWDTILAAARKYEEL